MQLVMWLRCKVLYPEGLLWWKPEYLIETADTRDMFLKMVNVFILVLSRSEEVVAIETITLSITTQMQSVLISDMYKFTMNYDILHILSDRTARSLHINLNIRTKMALLRAYFNIVSKHGTRQYWNHVLHVTETSALCSSMSAYRIPSGGFRTRTSVPVR